MKELYKDIPGYEGFYQVSNLGSIRSISRLVNSKEGQRKYRKEGRVLKQHKTPSGYLRVELSTNGKAKKHPAHRLVAITFIPNPEDKPQVNHKDGIKTNNMVDNLEWATPSEQMQHAYNKNLIKHKSKGAVGRLLGDHWGAKPIERISPDGTIKEYSCAKEAALEGFNYKDISAVCRGKRTHHKGYLWRFKEPKQ